MLTNPQNSVLINNNSSPQMENTHEQNNLCKGMICAYMIGVHFNVCKKVYFK